MTIINTIAGKMYSALCANDCTVSTEDGTMLKSISAHKQSYFIAPDTKLLSSDAALILTECAHPAPLEFVFGANSDYAESIAELNSTLADLQSTLEELGTETQTQLETLNEDLSSAAELITELQSDISAMDSQMDSLESEWTAEVSRLDDAVQSAMDNAAVYGDWDNAVSLDSSSFPYTCVANGWFVGSFSKGNADSLVYVNDWPVAKENNDTGSVQILLKENDVVSLSASLDSYALAFVPLLGVVSE